MLLRRIVEFPIVAVFERPIPSGNGISIVFRFDASRQVLPGAFPLRDVCRQGLFQTRYLAALYRRANAFESLLLVEAPVLREQFLNGRSLRRAEAELLLEVIVASDIPLDSAARHVRGRDEVGQINSLDHIALAVGVGPVRPRLVGIVQGGAVSEWERTGQHIRLCLVSEMFRRAREVLVPLQMRAVLGYEVAHAVEVGFDAGEALVGPCVDIGVQRHA